ncbi:MAG: futalosine hydrolase [Bacteroidota bacterium]
MDILIVAATAAEVNGLFKHPAPISNDWGKSIFFRHDRLGVRLLITGPGMVPTTYFMGSLLATAHFDVALNIGITGSFTHEIPIGETCHIISDRFAETGADYEDGFVPLYSMKMAQHYKPVFMDSGGNIMNNSYPQLLSLNKLKKAVGITVNTVSGNENAIEILKRRTQAETESMEGAAFFYACMMHNLPCMQVRTVSNYVAPPEKSQWNIAKALENLSLHSDYILEELNQQAS